MPLMPLTGNRCGRIKSRILSFHTMQSMSVWADCRRGEWNRIGKNTEIVWRRVLRLKWVFQKKTKRKNSDVTPSAPMAHFHQANTTRFVVFLILFIFSFELRGFFTHRFAQRLGFVVFFYYFLLRNRFVSVAVIQFDVHYLMSRFFRRR